MRHVQPGRGPYHSGHAAAFAEGRRLREMSRAHRNFQRSSPPGWVLALILIPAGAMMLSVLTVLFSMLAVFGVMTWSAVPLLPFLMVGGTSFAITRAARRRALRRGWAPGTAPVPARPASPPRPDIVWGHARRRFASLRTAYAAYECDPMAVLRLPALADVSVPSTARFVDAFAEAQALDTDLFPGGPHATSFVTAVDRAERAWTAAKEAAERIRLSTLSPAERATVERVIKLLTTARDSDSDAERIAAYTRARSELGKLDKAGVVYVPLPARAALDRAARGVLPG